MDNTEPQPMCPEATAPLIATNDSENAATGQPESMDDSPISPDRGEKEKDNDLKEAALIIKKKKAEVTEGEETTEKKKIKGETEKGEQPQNENDPDMSSVSENVVTEQPESMDVCPISPDSGKKDKDVNLKEASLIENNEGAEVTEGEETTEKQKRKDETEKGEQPQNENASVRTLLEEKDKQLKYAEPQNAELIKTNKELQDRIQVLEMQLKKLKEELQQQKNTKPDSSVQVTAENEDPPSDDFEILDCGSDQGCFLLTCNLTPDEGKDNQFKGTDCVCLYVNSKVTEGKTEGRVIVLTQKQDNGKVWIQLKIPGLKNQDEFTLIGPDNQVGYPPSAVTLSCYLSPEVSAVDMEIRWFKETQLVCLYKNRRVIKGSGYEDKVNFINEELERGNVYLQLRNVVWADSGDYLCQVISGDRTHEYSVKVGAPLLNYLLGSPDSVTVQKSGKKWTKEERNKMEESLSSITIVNFYKMVTGKTLDNDESFIKLLRKQFQGLMQVEGPECDFALVFCPIVSRAGTDIEAAVSAFKAEKVDKPAVFVVLHHTHDPQKVIQNSRYYVKMDDALTVDCLFHEDKGFLECSRNNEAKVEVVEKIKQIIRKQKRGDPGKSGYEAMNMEF